MDNYLEMFGRQLYGTNSADQSFSRQRKGFVLESK